MNIDGIDGVLEIISGEAFEEFKKDYYGDNNYYSLDEILLTNALFNAQKDIERVASFHSPSSGADVYRQISYITKWIANIKPIQIQSYPVNLNNSIHLNMSRINSAFATYIVAFVMNEIGGDMSISLKRDLQYCFEFRQSMSADSLSLILKHSNTLVS